jgi:flavorubredoxin
VAEEVLPGVHMIQECGPHREGFARSRNRHPVDWYREGRDVHVPQNAYLFVGDEEGESLLFDTLSPAGGELLLEELSALLGEGELGYLVVSHPDVPHAGNTGRVLTSYPDCRLVAPAVGCNHGLYHLDEALLVEPGDTLELGGHRLRFHEATFLDAPMSIWMSEENTGTLLPVDWLGIPHLGGECGRFADQIGLSEDEWISRLVEFHGRVMFWYEYVDAPKVLAEIDRIAEEVAPRHLGPAHGLFVREDPDRFLRWMKTVVTTIVERGAVGTLG